MRATGPTRSPEIRSTSSCCRTTQWHGATASHRGGSRMSKKSSQLVSLAGLAALAAGLAAAAIKAKQAAAQSPLTSRFSRTAKVWKLSARNTARFAAYKVRGATSPADRRAALDEQFAIRTAEDVAKQLGEMKGVLMKAGQLVSFIFETLPEDAQAALATLQADAAPM